MAGKIIKNIIKGMLYGIWFLIKLILLGGKIFLLMLIAFGRIFLSFVKAGTP